MSHWRAHDDDRRWPFIWTIAISLALWLVIGLACHGGWRALHQRPVHTRTPSTAIMPNPDVAR